MASTPVTIHNTKEHLHTRVRDTILGIEQMLLQLPQRGDKVEVTTTTERKCAPGQRVTNDVVLPDKSYISTTAATTTTTSSTRKSKKGHAAEKPKSRAEVLPGSVCINNLKDMAGVTVNVAVKVTTKEGSRLVLMTIECSDFVPRRLRCDNRWYHIE